MNRSFAFVISGLFFTLSGCQTSSFKHIQSEQKLIESRIPKIWETSLQQGTLPQNWAELFDDPLLTQYMQQAETRNTDIARAVILVRQAKAGLKTTRSILLPSLAGDIGISGVTGLNDFGINENFGDGISVSYDPGLFGRNQIEIQLAERLLDANLANEERIRRVVMAQIARTYILIIETEYQLNLARGNLEFIGETLRIAEARFNAGDIARDQFALAQLETANAEANVFALELTTRDLRRSLSLLIGDNPDAKLKVADDLPEPAEIKLSIVPAEVLGRRFDVAASRARIASNFATLQQTERLNWPSLSLTGRLSGGGGEVQNIFDIDSYIANLAGSLTATLFDGGRKEAQIENARAGIDDALLEYELILRQALSEIESGFDRISTEMRSLEALRRASLAATKTLELEKIKYDLGESIILDVLTVQRRVNIILASHILSQRQLLDAQIDTYLALGGEPIK